MRGVFNAVTRYVASDLYPRHHLFKLWCVWVCACMPLHALAHPTHQAGVCDRND